MTCQSALELLLDAEPSEFSANQSTPLGEHLRGCARCRGVAAQLLQDTQGLALAMEAAPVRRPARRVRYLTLAPTFAMAAIVLAVMVRARPDVTAVPVMRAPVPVERPTPPAVTSHSSTPDARVAAASPGRAMRREMRAFAPAVPLAPVRLARSEPVAPGAEVSSSGVTVTTPVGTRATVMHTSNPNLVVVWLY